MCPCTAWSASRNGPLNVQQLTGQGIPLSQIDCIIHRPDVDEPGIRFWLEDGRSVLHVYANDAECDAVWDTIEKRVYNHDFVRYMQFFFRPTRLRSYKKSHSLEHGLHIELTFINGYVHRETCEDADRLDEDWGTLEQVFSKMQDMLQNSRSSDKLQ